MATRTQELLGGMALGITTVAVVLSPWLFGSADPWAYLLVSMGVFAGAAVWLFGLIADPFVRPRTPAALVLLLVLVGFLSLQLPRWPLPWVRAVDPAAAEMTQRQVDLFRATRVADFTPGDPGLLDPRAALSLAPGATRRSLWLFGTYLAAFAVFAHTIRSTRRLRTVAGVLAVNAFILAVVSLVHKSSGSKLLLWIYHPPYGGNGFGPFTNRNHLAGYLVMMFGVVLGLLQSAMRDDAPAPPDDDPGLRACLRRLSRREVSRNALLLVALAVIGGTVCATLSRGAVASLLAAMGVAALLAVARPSGRKRLRPLLAGALALAVVVVWLGWRPLLDRMGTVADAVFDPAAEHRVMAARDALMILGAFPWTGAGFGTFQHIFPTVQSPALQFGRWLHAHNDWVQLLAEGGVVGAALALGAAFVLARTVLRAVRGRDGRTRLLLVGVVVGIAGAVFDGFVDYSLRKPANALLLATLCGLAAAAAHLLRVHGARSSRDGRTGGDGYAPPTLVRLLSLGLLVLLVLQFPAELNALRGEWAYLRLNYEARALEDTVPPDRGKAALRVIDADTLEAIQSQPDNPVLMRDAARDCFALALREELPREERLNLAERSLRCAALSVRAAPSDYLGWLWLARANVLVGRAEVARDCLARAQQLRPGAEAELFPKRD